jgi:GNAT superfamily N-acetyltransferase
MRSSINPGDSSAPQLHIHRAAMNDATRIAALINAAFVVERVAFDGDRIDLEGVQLLLSKGTFLVAEPAAALPSSAALGLLGCVYVEPRGDSCYLGLLAVSPHLQGQGLGRQLAIAAEGFAREAGCTAVDVRIISPRAESLLPIYKRLGYLEAGIEPFPPDVPVKAPCHYVLMVKALE